MPAMLLGVGDFQIALQAGRAERITASGAPLLPAAYRLTGGAVTVLHPFDETFFFRHGWHSWSLSSWLSMSRGLPVPQPAIRHPMIDHPTLLAHYPFSGSAVAALQGPDGGILLLGALGLDGFVRADTQTLTGAYWSPTGDEPAWFLGYGPEEEVFSAYAGLLGERFGRRGQDRPPKVWCSWYSLYRDIDAGTLLGILPTLDGLPFDVFQVDDGWQVSLGDWEANARFKQGMPALAEVIRARGLTPGLWLSPLAVAPGSTLFQQHPDWLIRAADGRPVVAGYNWGDVYYGLDVTHPAVQDWLAELIARVRAWGFEYLKLDFLYAAALPGSRHQPLAGEAALRLAMQIIRQAAGEAFILACGAPVLPCLGLADALRIGPDVAPIWDNPDRSSALADFSGPSTLNAIRTSLHRLWLRPLLHVDPDVAYFRARFNLLAPEQQRILQDLVQITGFLATSDPPAWLDPPERQALHDFLTAAPEVARLDRYRYRLGDRTVDFSFVEDAWPV